MRKLTNSLIGKATLGLSLVLTLCFFVLLAASSWMMRSAEFEQFETNSVTLTEYFADQVNTGTRLKRDTMVAPTVNGALDNPGIDIVAIRLVNVDGTEVIAASTDTTSSDLLAALPTASFDAPLSFEWDMPFLTIRAPVQLGAGADRSTVGEIVAVWSTQRSLAVLQKKFYLSIAALGITLLIMVAVSVLLLRRFVATPLNTTISAMTAIAEEVDEVVMPERSSIEIGEVVDALETFQTGIDERKRLEVAAQERRAAEAKFAEERAAADQAAREREQAKEAEARSRAEAEAETARRMMDDLGVVLGRAKAGDFSARMERDSSQDGQDVLRGLINDLMITVERGLDATTDVLNALADGDLSARMSGDFQGSFGELKEDANRMSHKLEEAMSGVAQSASGLSANAAELDSASKDLAKRTESSAAGLAETHAAVEAFASTAKSSAENAKEANTHVSKVRKQAEDTDQIVTTAVAAMTEISGASEQISQAVNVINDISFQTNLLALNAGVEAARAGEAGQGFAVVASEVRALAQRCADSARDIEQLISTSREQVSSGVKLVGDVSEALTAMSSSIQSVAELTDQISNGAQEQSSSAQEISSTLGEIDRATQRNAAMNEEVVAVAASVAETAKHMNGLVAAFKLSMDKTAEPGGRHNQAA
ncbi:MAG: methyl-accepting chemotaxis protein [Pseudomonadota bacterium]